LLQQLESNYDCANASADLHQLKLELEELITSQGDDNSAAAIELRNRIENQIHFIKNKCSIH